MFTQILAFAIMILTGCAGEGSQGVFSFSAGPYDHFIPRSTSQTRPSIFFANILVDNAGIPWCTIDQDVLYSKEAADTASNLLPRLDSPQLRDIAKGSAIELAGLDPFQMLGVAMGYEYIAFWSGRNAYASSDVAGSRASEVFTQIRQLADKSGDADTRRAAAYSRLAECWFGTQEKRGERFEEIGQAMLQPFPDIALRAFAFSIEAHVKQGDETTARRIAGLVAAKLKQFSAWSSYRYAQSLMVPGQSRGPRGNGDIANLR